MVDRFFILEVTGDQHRFVEVEGEAVDIGGVKAFATNESHKSNPLEFWHVSDLVGGFRLSKLFALKEEAIMKAQEAVKHHKERIDWRREVLIERYGRSPAVTE